MDSKKNKVSTSAAAVRKTECPNCLQIPRVQIFQCANGHSFCDICSSKMKICPTCRSRGVKIRNLLAEALLDDVQFKCTLGCEKTMPRGQLSAHEDQCDQNPNTIKFCAIFQKLYHRNICQYKCSSMGLTESENCSKFISSIKTCKGYVCVENLEVGKCHTSVLERKCLEKLPIILSSTASQFLKPVVFRFQGSANRKEQLFVLVNMLRKDKSGNIVMSCVIVQLTPEVTPISVKVTLNGNPQSEATLSWIIKPIGFTAFKKMVEVPQGKGVSYPFSVPLSFLSEYYVNAKGKLGDFITFELLI